MARRGLLPRQQDLREAQVKNILKHNSYMSPEDNHHPTRDSGIRRCGSYAFPLVSPRALITHSHHPDPGAPLPLSPSPHFLPREIWAHSFLSSLFKIPKFFKILKENFNFLPPRSSVRLPLSADLLYCVLQPVLGDSVHVHIRVRGGGLKCRRRPRGEILWETYGRSFIGMWNPLCPWRFFIRPSEGGI